MRVLLIKTSSMGDIIHTFPALTDAAAAIVGIEFDWLVEEAFADMPAWHPAVREVKTVAIRRWRKNLIKAWREGEYCRLRQWILQQNYDLILDAQSLFKSAWLSFKLPITTVGLASDSARDPLASVFFDRKIHVDKNLHAVERVRSLFAQALNYQQPAYTGDYGLDKKALSSQADVSKFGRYSFFLHGTTWASKHWPEQNWRKLAEYFQQRGQTVLLSWGNEEERLRAERIANNLTGFTVLPKMTITELSAYIAQAQLCVAVDTGLGHLSAAFDVPTVSLYGPTDPAKIGAYGKQQIHLTDAGPYAGSGNKHKACFETLTAQQVIKEIEQRNLLSD